MSTTIIDELTCYEQIQKSLLEFIPKTSIRTFSETLGHRVYSSWTQRLFYGHIRVVPDTVMTGYLANGRAGYRISG